MCTSNKESKKVKVGTVVSVKGLNGEVKIKPYFSAPLSLKDYKLFLTLSSSHKKQLPNFVESRIKKAYIHKNLLIALFEGINSISHAEKIIGHDIYINKEDMPCIDESTADEYYYSDIIGLDVKNSDNKIIGKVKGLDNYGASDIIEIELDDSYNNVPNKQKANILLPFIKKFVLEVDIQKGYIVIANYNEV